MNRSICTEPFPNSDELFTVTLNSTTTITTTVTCSSSSVTAWLSALRSSSSPTTIVGLDIEWRPNNANHENPVSLLQLCVGNTCLLFQLLYADSIPSSLISFLKDPNYKFLGVGIKGDVEKLICDYDLGVRNSVDLRNLAKQKTGRGEMKQMGIKKLAMEVLGIEINKPKRISMSRWDMEWLMLDQIGYATIDAYLSFEIGRRLYAMGSTSTQTAGST